MSNSRTLCIGLVLSLALVACAKKGGAPEPQSAGEMEQSATATPMQTSPQVSQAMPRPSWETTPGPSAEPAMPPPIMGSETTAAPVALTDEQIVMITETVDEGEIEHAKLAQKKAKDARVKKYASTMLSEHTKSKRKGADLAKEANLSVADSPIASDLEGKTMQELEMLRSADATEFDRTYTQAQITRHQAVLDLLNNQLIPNASHPDLKTKLEEARSMVQTHLQEAMEIQRKLMSREEAGERGGQGRVRRDMDTPGSEPKAPQD